MTDQPVSLSDIRQGLDDHFDDLSEALDAIERLRSQLDYLIERGYEMQRIDDPEDT